MTQGQEEQFQVLNISRGVVQQMVRQVIINELGGSRAALRAEIDQMVEAAVKAHLPTVKDSIDRRVDDLITTGVARAIYTWGGARGVEKRLAEEVKAAVSQVIALQVEQLVMDITLSLRKKE
jgi:predicted TIM-barrel enzyme